MFLLDTNCWMQIARARPQAGDVLQLLGAVPLRHLNLSIYSVHSIGILLRRHGMAGQYAGFLARMSIGTMIRVIDVPLIQLGLVDDACTNLNLDFDDAYQYVVADLHNLKIVSLDADFDRTPRGRLEPLAALNDYQASQSPNP